MRPLALEARIQEALRRAASRFREIERLGPFLATFTPDSENPYLSYALPDDGARPSAEEIAALVTAFDRRARKPRLEYLTPLAPEVEPALVAAGFAVEVRAPLLVCEPGALRVVSAARPRKPEPREGGGAGLGRPPSF